MIDCENIVCVGSVSFDLIFQVDRMPEAHEKLRCSHVKQACGGSAANSANWLARLGHRVAFTGCVGDDELGRACSAALRAVGVCIDEMQVTSKASTGIATVFVNQADKRMVTARAANDYFDPSRIRFEQIGENTHVHVSMLDDDRAVFVLRESKRRGASTSCEFNGSKSAQRVKFCDICFMNSDELSRWLGPAEPLIRWREQFGRLDSSLVVTQGAKGATVMRHDQTFTANVTSTEVVDRTGGGDAFDAGYLSGFVRQFEPPACLQMGLELARQVIGHVGSAPAEIDAATLQRITNWPKA